MISEEVVPLIACPFCPAVPTLPEGIGTVYEIECTECGCAHVSVQIRDLMTVEERSANLFANDSYPPEVVARAMREAVRRWNRRSVPAATASNGAQAGTVEAVPPPETAQDQNRVDVAYEHFGDWYRRVHGITPSAAADIGPVTCAAMENMRTGFVAALQSYTQGQWGEVIAWVRFCSDGTYEGPLMDRDRRMSDVRRNSGAWTPLYAPKAAGPEQGDLAEALHRIAKLQYAGDPFKHSGTMVMIAENALASFQRFTAGAGARHVAT